VHNPAFRGFDPRRLTWMFTTTLMGHYAPLTWLSHAIDFSVSGLDPAAFHRTNLLLHAANAALFCLLASRICSLARPETSAAHPVGLRISALCAALAFAVHPLRTETVAWITERRGLLATFFLLLALLAYLRSFTAREVPCASQKAYAACILFLVCSLLSKALGMTFVAVVLVLDVYPLRRLPERVRGWWDPSVRAVWIQKIPFALLGVASAAVSARAQVSAADTVKSLAAWGPLARLGQALFGLAFYVRKTVVPTGLAGLVELPFRFDFFEARFLASAISVGVLATALLLVRRRAPALVAASAIYILVLAPVLGFLQSGPQLVADRYSYVACMPWAILAGGAVLVAIESWPTLASRVLLAASALLLALLFVLSRRQAATWLDSATLWTHAIEVGEDSSVARVNLGGLLAEAGDDAGAIEDYLAATRLRPDNGVAWFNLGILYARQDRLEDAERADREACRTMTPPYKPFVNLGNLYRNRMGRLDDAIEAYRAAVADADASAPLMYSPVPHLVLGVALRQKGLEEEGRRHLEIAARHPETRAEALRELGR
jgi:tetratricopeptide (TPR) repeat protein